MEGTVRKKARKGKPVASKSDSAIQGNENILDSNIYLTYDILRIVFQYLDGRDLASAAMVCRSWLEAANNEKCTRGPCCFLQLYKVNDFLNCIKTIRIKPSIGFFFIPENVPRIIEDRIESVLPEHCEAIMLYSKGIIIDNNEMECRPFPNIVCAFLPQIPNVRIQSFKLSQHCFIRRSPEYREIISTIANNKRSMSSHETSTFMLFCNCMGHPTAERWASAVQKSRGNNIVSVWGGVLQDVYEPRTCKKKSLFIKKKIECFQRMDLPDCIAVLITGPIQTWSTVLERKCNTKEQVEARLKLFKDEVKLKKHSMGFMFVCEARGTEMYTETNVESTIFKRLFPKVPLVGCFGYGEFGKTTDEVNEEKNSKEIHKRKKPKPWYNEFSTVFLILTYG